MKPGLLVIALAVAIFASACLSGGYVSFYRQIAPSKYPPPDQVRVFSYPNADLATVYELFYSDFLLIGKSAFNGAYENPSGAVSFARKLGADVLITSMQSTGTQTAFLNLSVPKADQTSISGYSQLTGQFYASATTYRTERKSIPVTVNRYDQDAFFLRNMSDAKPLWELSRSDIQPEGTHDWAGVWENESYSLEIVPAGGQLAAFLTKPSTHNERFVREYWETGDLKFLCGIDGEQGVYIMGDKAPQPAVFSVNKFGHLVVELILQDMEAISFGRQ